MKNIHKIFYVVSISFAAFSMGCGEFSENNAISSETGAEQVDCDPFDYEGGRCDPLRLLRENRCDRWARANMNVYEECAGSPGLSFEERGMIEADTFDLCVTESYEFGIPSESCIQEAERFCGPFFSGIGPNSGSNLFCGGDPSLPKNGADPAF